MDNDHGITGELREWFKDRIFMANGWQELHDIADRIDAEHEKAMSRAAQLLADAEEARDFNYSNWQECKQKVLQHNITFDELNARIECLKEELSRCIELPKDADGEYIHIGDEMEWVPTCGVGGTRHGTVTGIKTDEVGDELFHEIAVNDGGFSARLMASNLHHYRKPTVEDVLCELLDKVDDDRAGQAEIIAEYAKRLRLAGDE